MNDHSSPSPESSGERPNTDEMRDAAFVFYASQGEHCAEMLTAAADWIDAQPAPASPSEGSVTVPRAAWENLRGRIRRGDDSYAVQAAARHLVAAADRGADKP